MGGRSFAATFEALTGHRPFPWQEALYDRFKRGEIPKSCNLPTGLGKTSVIAVWLIALANHPERMPRRLVYVVNRRTAVDQPTVEVGLCHAFASASPNAFQAGRMRIRAARRLACELRERYHWAGAAAG